MSFINKKETKKTPDPESMIRKNTNEVSTKIKATVFLNNRYGTRAVLYERSWKRARYDILFASRTKKVIICEVKTENDKIKKEQLKLYMKMAEIVWIALEDSDKLKKQIKNIPDGCGIVIMSDSYKIIVEPKQQVIKKRSLAPITANFFPKNTHLTYPQFLKLFWYSIIVYSRFHINKTTPDKKIKFSKLSKMNFIKTTATMNKYINKFFKKIYPEYSISKKKLNN